jgi:ubiquitin-conjugating enzyme E2 D/E
LRGTDGVGYPHRDDAVEGSIADEYKTRKASFEKTAKDWTKQYAK